MLKTDFLIQNIQIAWFVYCVKYIALKYYTSVSYKTKNNYTF
jgi:hypothetical protein